MPSNVYKKDVGAGDVSTGAGDVGTCTLVAGSGAAAYVELVDGTGGNPIAELRAAQGTIATIALHGRTILSSAYADAFTGAGAVVYVEML